MIPTMMHQDGGIAPRSISPSLLRLPRCCTLTLFPTLISLDFPVGRGWLKKAKALSATRDTRTRLAPSTVATCRVCSISWALCCLCGFHGSVLRGKSRPPSHLTCIFTAILQTSGGKQCVPLRGVMLRYAFLSISPHDRVSISPHDR